MLIKYTEWRNAVRFSSTYDSTMIWNRVKKEIKYDLEINNIKLPDDILERIDENTITAILVDNNGADWTKAITIKWHEYWSESLYDFLKELCDDIEYDIINYNYELEDSGDIIDSEREMIEE